MSVFIKSSRIPNSSLNSEEEPPFSVYSQKFTDMYCDIYLPTLGIRGELRPTTSHREEACMPAVGT